MIMNDIPQTWDRLCDTVLSLQASWFINHRTKGEPIVFASPALLAYGRTTARGIQYIDQWIGFRPAASLCGVPIYVSNTLRRNEFVPTARYSWHDHVPAFAPFGG